jgi:DNA polymerase III delta prime subunit
MNATGYIANIVRQRGRMTSFQIVRSDTPEPMTVVVEPNDFLPVYNGDKIFAKLSSVRGSKDFKLKTKPFVIISTDPIDVLEFLKSVLWKREDHNTVDAMMILALQRERETNTEMTYCDLMNQYSMIFEYAGKFSELPKLGVDPAKVQKLLGRWYRGRVMRQLYLLGLRKREIRDAHKQGIDELQLYNRCRENPYRVANVPIDTCKIIMEMQNMTPTQEQLYCGSVLRWVYSKLMDGWSFVPEKKLLQNFPSYDDHLQKLTEEYDLVFDKSATRVYHSSAYRAEVGVAEFVEKLLATTCEPPPIDWTTNDFNYSEEQKAAVIGTLSHPISIFTGPPGSGKTTTLKKIIEALKAKGETFQVAAYTGKAVDLLCKRLGEKDIALTLDLLITVSSSKQSKVSQTFKYVIIDEATMCSTGKLYELISAYPGIEHIIFCGDEYQLPPIAYGNLFTSLIQCGRVPVFELSTVYRVDGDESANILRNCETIRKGFADYSMPVLKKGKGYYECFGSIDKVYELIANLHESKIDTVEFRVLCPFTKPREQFNSFIQEYYKECNLEKGNKSRLETITKMDPTGTERTWRIGDLVIVNENDYHFDLKNGQEGVITNISSESVEVSFESFGYTVPVRFFFEPRDDDASIAMIELSYCLTVHKAQGSEYSIVILYVPERESSKSKGAFLNRNLLYTGLSRPKTLIYACGHKKTFYEALTKMVPHRYEALCERLGVPEEDIVDDDGGYDDYDVYDENGEMIF